MLLKATSRPASPLVSLSLSQPRLQQMLPQDSLDLGHRLKMVMDLGVARPHVEFTHHAGIAGARLGDHTVGSLTGDGMVHDANH